MTKVVPVSNFRLFIHIFSILSLLLSLKNYLKANLSTLTKTEVLPLQPTRLMWSNSYMPIITPRPMWELPNLT